MHISKTDRVAKMMLVIGAALALSACASGVDITTEPVNPIYNAQGARQTANGTETVEVRTFVGRRQEITDVPCQISSPFYAARAVTPAQIILPSFAEQTPAITMSCTHEGETRSASFTPVNRTVEKRTRAWGGGLLTYAMVAGSTKAENSVFGYNQLRIDFGQAE